MRPPRRGTEGFNLSFLDIMACGLGAVTLIFMLVKFDSERPGEEAHALQADLVEIKDLQTQVETQNSELTARMRTLIEQLQQRQAERKQQETEGAEMVSELVRLTKEIADLQSRPLAPGATAASGEKPRQDHLIGLKVSGSRILILLDISASMAEERLVDIVRVKVSDIEVKKAASKWVRTLAIVNWILDRVPENGLYSIVRYNDKAEYLLPEKEWVKESDAGVRQEVTRALRELHPHNATDLQQALAFVLGSRYQPTDIYLITDSLPTRGKLRRGQQRRHCGGARNRNVVSGSCRLALFYEAIRAMGKEGLDIRVNTVLLPIEGDPQAAQAYWVWSAATTGTMISPGAYWP